MSSTGAFTGHPIPINEAVFRDLFPRCPTGWAAAFLPYFNAACLEAEISTGRRLAYFAAQLGHESLDLSAWEEKADGWAYDLSQNARLAKRLGNVLPGDGPKFKGRGPLQLTGRANYRAAGKALGLPLEDNPARAAHRDVGLRVAAWFWTSHGLNQFADLGAFDEVTQRINGGQNGAADRRKRLIRCMAVLRCN